MQRRGVALDREHVVPAPAGDRGRVSLWCALRPGSPPLRSAPRRAREQVQRRGEVQGRLAMSVQQRSTSATRGSPGPRRQQRRGALRSPLASSMRWSITRGWRTVNDTAACWPTRAWWCRADHQPTRPRPPRARTPRRTCDLASTPPPASAEHSAHQLVQQRPTHSDRGELAGLAHHSTTVSAGAPPEPAANADLTRAHRLSDHPRSVLTSPAGHHSLTMLPHSSGHGATLRRRGISGCWSAAHELDVPEDSQPRTTPTHTPLPITPPQTMTSQPTRRLRYCSSRIASPPPRVPGVG